MHYPRPGGFVKKNEASKTTPMSRGSRGLVGGFGGRFPWRRRRRTMPAMMSARMVKRIGFGAALIAGVGGIFWLDFSLHAATDGAMWAVSLRFPALPVAAVMVMLLGVGFVEYARLARLAGSRVLWLTGLAGVTLLGLSPWLPLLSDISWGYRLVQNLPVTLGVWLMLVFCEQMFRARLDGAMSAVGATVLGAAYLGLGGAAILSIRLSQGPANLLLFLAVVKVTDIGAYFTGSLLGRHKMIPWLSPGKTWEGLVGGLVTAGVLGAVWSWAGGSPAGVTPLGFPAAAGYAVFAVLVGAAGQVGDLCESLLKRSAGAKDSAAIVPEFGGVLDMLDSPLLAAPVAWFLMPILMW